MKPERLILSAWGPYPEETDIDFKTAGENGLFLITGPTGSGKTTLFDGISFALFGEVSGSVRENNSLRSDFATAESETYVKLYFRHKNQEYEIYRSPRYERPKKRGNGSILQAEKAELYTNGTLTASGTREVTEAIQELLGMNAVQFKQISMIAQGEFQKLLTAGGKERTQIFRTLFHTRNVDMAGRLLGDRAKKIYSSYNNLVQRIQEAVTSIEPEKDEELQQLCAGKADAETLLPLVKELLKREKKRYKKLEKEYAILEQEAGRAALVLENRNRIARLKSGIVEIENELSQKKKKLVTEQQELEQLTRENSEERLRQAESELQRLREQKEALRKWQQEQKKLQKEEQELEKLQEQYLLEERREKDSQQAYEQIFSLYRRMSAGILAKDLEEGEPCPVCGSLHHPKKAEEGQTVSKEELNQAKAIWDMQREKTAAVHARTVECHAQVRLHKEQLEQETKNLPKEQELIEAEEQLQQEQKHCKELARRREILKKQVEEALLMIERRLAQKEALERELSECPRDIGEDSEETLLETRRQMEAMAAEKEKLHTCMVVNEKVIHSIEDKLADVITLRRQYGIVSDVEQLIKGNNPKRLVWEQYVLSVYFDTMLHAANLRLSPMSDGRYEMFRVESVGDLRSRDSLEIEVLDHYTGKRRSAKSLSGGEAFKASLSLALGMSDMIQSFAGGIEVDALFVDEGFGALDAQSLEQSLQVLQGLTGKSRMVGIISHVQELKDRIERQIVIEKTNTGSQVKGIG